MDKQPHLWVKCIVDFNKSAHQCIIFVLQSDKISINLEKQINNC